MKGLILHLSDIHLEVNDLKVQERFSIFEKAVNQVAPGVSACFIVISGDLVLKGKKEEYDKLAEILIQLKKNLLQSNFKAVHYVVVPGNHDLDMALDTIARQRLVDQLQQDHSEIKVDRSIIDICISPQSPFFNFLKIIRDDGYYEPSNLNNQLSFNINGFSFIFNCINSAWISTNPELQGKLRFPMSYLHSDNDFQQKVVVSVLHHPYIWFKSEDARKLRGILTANSNFVLTGHEHEDEEFKVLDANGKVCDYYEGGIFYRKDSMNSSFTAIIIDCDSHTYWLDQFRYDGSIFHSTKHGYSTCAQPIQSRNRGTSFIPTSKHEAYLDSLEYDFKHPRKDDLTLPDVYVFPDLRHSRVKDNVGKEDQPVDDLKEFIVKHKRVIVVGIHQIGKTSLLKTIFRPLLFDLSLVPIIIDGSNIAKTTPDKLNEIVDESIGLTYGSDKIDLYRQLPNSKRIVLIDNFDKSPLNFRGKDAVLNQFKAMFDYTVLTSTGLIDIEDLLEKDTSIFEYERITISEFGYFLRNKLIEKWIRVGDHHLENENEIQQKLIDLDHSINSVIGNRVLPYTPFIILTLLQATELNYDISTASGAYGYYYEILIKATIAKTSKTTRETGIKLGFLSCLAYYMFCKQSQSVLETEIPEFCANVYKPHSKLTIDSIKMFRELLASRVLVVENKVVVFNHKYEYQYFVASFMADNIDSKNEATKDQVKYQINHLCNNLHKENYANIIMFMGYLSRNPFLIDVLLDNANSLFQDAKPIEFQNDVKFINKLEPKNITSKFSELPPEQTKEAVLRSRDKADNANDNPLISQSEVEVASELNLLQQIVYSFAVINILGQILKNYLGIIDSTLAQNITHSSSLLGLRILSTVLSNFEDNLPENKEEFIRYLDKKEKNLNESEKDARFANYIFATSLLLSLLVIRNVTLAIGAPELESVYQDLKTQFNVLSTNILLYSIRLEHYKERPIRELIEINKEAKHNAFAKEIIAQLTVQNMYLYFWGRKELQQGLTELGLEKIQGSPKFLLPKGKILRKIRPVKRKK